MSSIVIGGGLAGLTTATVLADAAEPITVLEGSTRLGGRAASDERSGQLLNQGAHAVYLAGEGIATLRRLGIDPAGRSPDNSGSLGLVGEEIHQLPGSARALLTTSLLPGRQRLEMARIMVSLSRLDATGLSDRSTLDWIHEITSSSGPRGILTGLARVSSYAANLERLSADVGAAQLKLALRGVRYLDGGWGALVAALADRATASGAEICCGQRVERIEHTGAGVTVTTAAGALSADQVVLAGLSPAAAARLSGSSHLTAWAARQQPLTVACLDVGLRALPRPERTFAYDLEKPLYYSVHNPPAKLGPGNVVHVMKYLSQPATGDDGNGTGDHRAIRAELEALLERMQPGWRDQLISSTFLRRMVVSHVIPTAMEGGAAGRYPSRPPDLERVMLAGDWVGPVGHIADASIVSGRAAAAEVLGARHLALR